MQGIFDLYPNLCHRFLSLNDCSETLANETPEQELIRQVLIHFDLLTTCNLRNFLRAATFFRAKQNELKALPLLDSLTEPLIHWSILDYEKAQMGFDQYLSDYPCDVIVFFMRHMLDFCCGKTHELQNLIKVTDQKLPKEHPLYGYYLGIKSFVLCESGKYLEALSTGLNSYNTLQDNTYGIHAVIHAYHEMGEHQKVIDFLQKTSNIWMTNSGMQMHVYWHMALAQLNLFSLEKARKGFAEFYSMKSSDIAEQDLDAVNFLWHYRLCLPEDNRYDELWNQLAEKWTGCIGSSTSYFHDIHAALSFAVTKKPFLIKKMIARSDGTGVPNGSHKLGIEVLEAIYYYALEQYYECALRLSRTKEQWFRLGGSHAQREILSITLQDALYRSTK